MSIMEIIPEYISDPFPERLKQGIIYISKDRDIAAHLCCCGCGQETITPLKPLNSDGWKFSDTNGLVTLSPSIGNFSSPCRSHYFIRNNKIVWT